MSKDNSRENSLNSATIRNSNVITGNGSSAEPEWRTGRINGNTFRNKEVKYRIINGMAIFEGDIILARTPQEIERLSPEHKVPSENEPSVRPSVKAVVRTGDQYRWPRGEIPFVIQTTLPNQDRVNDAIRHWELKPQFALSSAQALMLHIIQTMFHSNNMFHSQMKNKTFFTVRRLLECRVENSLYWYLIVCYWRCNTRDWTYCGIMA